MNIPTHSFCQRITTREGHCQPCGKKIKFPEVAAKCRNCRVKVHTNCKEQLLLPCVLCFKTPTRCGQCGVLSDYTRLPKPMVPALLQYCVREIETRRLKEFGIYAVPGSDREVKALKKKFRKNRGAPNLSDIELPAICSTIKDFFLFLPEPLITMSLWEKFVECVEFEDEEYQQVQLYKVVSELPQPNRDTLAFFILHLQRVTTCAAFQMPARNLAIIFGPTLIGYSTPNPNPLTMLNETRKQVAVVELLIETPWWYWSTVLNTGSN